MLRSVLLNALFGSSFRSFLLGAIIMGLEFVKETVCVGFSHCFRFLPWELTSEVYGLAFSPSLPFLLLSLLSSLLPLFLSSFFFVIEIEPRALYMLDKCSTTKFYLQQ